MQETREKVLKYVSPICCNNIIQGTKKVSLNVVNHYNFVILFLNATLINYQ